MIEVPAPLAIAWRDPAYSIKQSGSRFAVSDKSRNVAGESLVGRAQDKPTDLSDANPDAWLRCLDRAALRTALDLDVDVGGG